MYLKISVLASGAVLLDGVAVPAERVDAALEKVKAANGSVWYYREPAADPKTIGMAILEKALAHKLPVSISSRSDFSDCLDAKGVSHPRTEAGAAGQGIAAVAERSDIEAVFAKARQTAAAYQGQSGLVAVRPDRGLFVLPALAQSDALDQQAAGMERLIPSAVKRNIAVIADTRFTTETAPSVASANQAIPFFGLLIGLSYLGHHVWIFEGHAQALAAGTREADVLIVDSALESALEPGWQEIVAASMRNANILLHDRASCRLRIVRKVGQSPNRLEFA